ncbi:MAG: diacylglycerol kinase, partial [Kiritimatiellia bacterium]
LRLSPKRRLRRRTPYKSGPVWSAETESPLFFSAERVLVIERTRIRKAADVLQPSSVTRRKDKGKDYGKDKGAGACLVTFVFTVIFTLVFFGSENC